jgi:ABC-type lipoprotein release transport system permease subunit
MRRRSESDRYRGKRADPRTLGVVAVGLARVTLATGYAAARRVLKIDPAELLRRD